ncbi:hypothetical protein AQUCO_00201188v1 [Aquilegia coerulea]|uniref:Aquaporin n=1 Tax=Aquilegia coerulea TaxID=218851 RepID=A0A2G5F6Q5_AQUCA|nr:hypothetical protein AQUCO_00201188v1 [Aquilegia coerulea]
MAETENGTPNVSAPPTPGTPGAPLFTSLRVDSLSYDRDRKSMPRCTCLPVNTWTPTQGCITTDFPSPSDVSLTRKLGAEFVGTFILIFTATAGPIVNQKYNGAETLIGNAACAGLAVMIVILSTGHISGAHLNPSLTLAFATLRHFPWVQVPAYIVAQVSGSICASFALKGIFHPFMGGGVTVPSVSTGQAFALEFVITFQLLFVVTAVATDTRAVILLLISLEWSKTLDFLFSLHKMLTVLFFHLFDILGGRTGRNSCWCSSYDEYPYSRTVKWWIHESSTNFGASNSSK